MLGKELPQGLSDVGFDLPLQTQSDVAQRRLQQTRLDFVQTLLDQTGQGACVDTGDDCVAIRLGSDVGQYRQIVIIEGAGQARANPFSILRDIVSNETSSPTQAARGFRPVFVPVAVKLPVLWINVIDRVGIIVHAVPSDRSKY